MLVLGLDTSNYATSIAVYNTEENCIIYSDKRFLPVKKGERGLRQSDAVFHHTVALPDMLCNMQEFIAKKYSESRFGAVGVSCKPRPLQGSYMPCFLTGVNAARYFAAGANIPLVELTHQQGHIAAAIIGAQRPELFNEKSLVFHISGGTTELLLCDGVNVLDTIGTTTDLFAGQAVDRIGVKLGFDFPAGESLSNLAKECNEEIKLKVSVKGANCSLSGLENKCNALLDEGKEHAYIAKFCLTYIAQTLAEMLKFTIKTNKIQHVLFAGGVMSSDTIRQYLTAKFDNIYFAPPSYSADNAMGVAVIAANKIF